MEGSTAPAGLPAVETVTFLFTDIEGSTRLVQEFGDRYAAVNHRHHDILRLAAERHGGRVFRTAGDAVMAAFRLATAAVSAAIESQRELADEPWPDGITLRVRMGIHTGQVRAVNDDYDGLDLHRVARIMSVGWGEQVVVSAVTQALVAGRLEGVQLRDLGEHRLKDLASPERLYQVIAAGLRTEFPALRSLDVTPNNLPIQLTSFVGRAHELAEVVDLLAGTRLLTLTGPGGMGKTRLALQLAAEVTDRFPDGVYFVALADVADPGLVLPTVVNAIGLSDSGAEPPLERLAAHLEGKRSLLMLDNFEQVLDAAVDVAALLAAVPEISVVVTSRGPLRISGEKDFPVPPLGLPTDSRDPMAVMAHESVALFVTRASAVRPDFALTEQNADAVATIAQRLDGLPLALELAAARVRLLSPASIAERLGQRLDLLAGGARDLPERQRTLRAAIAWSHDLLDESTRQVFELLAVFVGGASLEALETLCGAALEVDVLDALDGLVDQSLVRVTDRDGQPRYEMLEVIREFALEQLEQRGNAAQLRRRHAEFFRDLAEQAAPHLEVGDQRMWLDRLEAEHANLRTAVGYAAELAETRVTLRLVAAAWRYWQIRGHLHEGRRLAEVALSTSGVEDHPEEAAVAHEAAGGLAYWQFDEEPMRFHYERSLDLFRQVDDQAGTARALYNLAFLHLGGGAGHPASDPEAARELLTQAHEVYDSLGDELGSARATWGLSNQALVVRDLDRSRTLVTECNRVFRARGARFDLAWGAYVLGVVELELGRLEAAQAAFEESLQLFRDVNDLPGLALLLTDFALLAEARQQWDRANRLFAASNRLATEAGTTLDSYYDWSLTRLGRADEQVAPEDLERLSAEGAALTHQEALTYALEDRLPTDPGGS